MREDDYEDVLKQHVKTSVKELNLWCGWVAKWLNDSSMKTLEWSPQKP